MVFVKDHKKLTIVMYHYVRDIAASAYPGIKGLEINDFKGQIEYLLQHYQPVRAEQLLAYLAEPSQNFPDNGFLLTFDDGYSDHYENVFPVLKQHGLQGCFFPPAQAILERKALDVNKIHYILACSNNIAELNQQLFTLLDTYRDGHSESSDLLTRDAYIEQFGIANRFDSAEVILFKRLLQRELPENIRSEITQTIFAEVVGLSDTDFANQLYMTLEQLQTMHQQGQWIGGHGYAHNWMSHLSDEQQQTDIQATIAFLQQIGVSEDKLSYCYPYGAYNENTLDILKQNNFKLGFTTQALLADIHPENALTLHRLDTNDLPCRSRNTV